METETPEQLLEWARKFESGGRRVAESLVGPWWVSTVFLGLDHTHLFETMAFLRGRPRRASDYQERCATWLEAEQQHAQACRLLRWSPRWWWHAFELLMERVDEYRAWDPHGRLRMRRQTFRAA